MIRAIIAALTLCATTAQGATTIRADNGGSVPEYAAMIADYRATGQKVRITGRCNSSCTMLLALPDVCVSRNARLGFHGPSSQFYGIRLAPAEFERWSQIMADHYPATIRAWFMQVARYTFDDVLTVRGSELIDNHGVKQC
jgi:hypothetical protein